jgi:hypothetical protein
VYGHKSRKRTVDDANNTEEDSVWKEMDNISYFDIIRDIVDEEDIAVLRQWAFISYGNFVNYFFFAPGYKFDNNPLSYDKFLISVFLSLSEIRIGMPDSVYMQFLEEVLLPLSHDLALKGQAIPPIVVDNAFVEQMSRYVRQDRSKLPKWLFPTKYLISSFIFPEPIPSEILWSGIYRKIDRFITIECYKDPYYLFKYYKKLQAEGDDVIAWGEALDWDVWRNYYVNSLLEYQLRLLERKKDFEGKLRIDFEKSIDKKVDEISDFILNLRRSEDVF